MKNKKKYELIDYFLFDERLSPAALKIHETWCRNNGYKPQANFKKKPQASFNKKPQAPRYKSSDYAARRAASK